jgi:hypothetical protein
MFTRKNSIRSLIVGAALTLSACGAGTPLFHPTTPQNDQAVVYVYRPARMTGALVPIGVRVDQREMVIWSGDYLAVNVAPGPHSITSGSVERQIDAAPRSETYARVLPGFVNPKLEVVDPARGSVEIASCHEPDR